MKPEMHELWSSLPAVAQECATPIGVTYAFLNGEGRENLKRFFEDARTGPVARRPGYRQSRRHEALLQEDRQYLGRQFGRTGDQQPATGLRIGEQRALDVAETLGIEHDVPAVARPVARRSAGDATRRVVERVGQDRQRRVVEFGGDARAPCRISTR